MADIMFDELLADLLLDDSGDRLLSLMPEDVRNFRYVGMREAWLSALTVASETPGLVSSYRESLEAPEPVDEYARLTRFVEWFNVSVWGPLD